MTTIALLLIAAALVAALLAAIQQAGELRRLREDLDAIAAGRVAPATVEAGAPGAQAPQLFSGLYATAEESSVAGLGRLPGVPVVALAAVLGLVGSGLIVTAAPRVSVAEAAATPPARDSEGELRSERDSLELLVSQLRDSLRTRPTADATPAPKPRGRPRSASKSAAPTTIPPAPTLVELPPVVP